MNSWTARGALKFGAPTLWSPSSRLKRLWGCRRLAIAQIHGTAGRRIHEADLSSPARVVNPAWSQGYSLPIVMSVNDFTVF